MIHDFIYLILKEKLKADLTDVKLIEWDEQKDERDGNLTTSPAVFLRFEPFEALDLQQGVQQCEMIITARLITDNAKDGDERIRHNSSGNTALSRELYISLQKFTEPDGMLSAIPEFVGLKDTEDDELIINSITRVGGSSDHSGEKLIRPEQQFRIVYYDCAAREEFQKLVAGFEITSFEIN